MLRLSVFQLSVYCVLLSRMSKTANSAYTNTLEECSASSESLRLCCLDHIVSNPGMVLPVEVLANLCYLHGAKKVFVDGAHAPGMIDRAAADADGAIAWTGNLHKWPCSLRGAAPSMADTCTSQERPSP